MTKNVGIWIDHRKSVIVRLEDGEPSVETLESELEGHIKLAGGSRQVTPYGPQDVASESNWERRYQQHLRRYLVEVAEKLGSPDSLFIFGPAEAKMELRKVLEERGLGDSISGYEPAEKMTDSQIVAKVRDFFSN